MTDISKDNSSSSGGDGDVAPFPLPRVTIKFCTQCKWMLRAAYYAQELLSTFSTSLGEVALQPSTGGTFVVEIFHSSPSSSSSSSSSSSPPNPTPTTTKTKTTLLWDRKTDGGFPETKELKRRVRDVIEPGRNLGHVDRDHHRHLSARPTTTASTTSTSAAAGGGGGGADVVVEKEEAPAPPGGAGGGETPQGGGNQANNKEECEDCK